MGRARNPNLKKANTEIQYTREQVLEMQKCASDPVYFIRNYVKVQHPVKGAVKFDLRPYQERMVLAFHSERFNIVLSARQTGKCVYGDTKVEVANIPSGIKRIILNLCKRKLINRLLPKQLLDKIANNCMNVRMVDIEQLHNIFNTTPCKIYDDQTNAIKFIEKGQPNDSLCVKTPTGWSLIKQTLKTIPFNVWKLQTENYTIKCADEHIIIDENDREVYVKNLSTGDRIKTSTGIEQVYSVSEWFTTPQHMYDIELDDKHHVYYTNNILSHNSVTSAAYLLWFAMFNFDKTVLIASNKDSNAQEMIFRMRYAYENLPHWIKPGIQEDGWNNHKIGFDNDSRIISTATSADSGRGLSISKLFLDEFAFVPPAVADEFWTSISPTLSTGGSCIITSTPNGDMNIFAELWRGANVGVNGFHPIHVRWDEPPGRDEKFKQDEIGRIGIRRWNQEYECQFLSSDALLIESQILHRLTEEVKQHQPLFKAQDVIFYKKPDPNETYLVGVDPATGSGEDYSVIEVFEFPSMIQVAEYRSNKMSTNVLYNILKNLLKYLEPSTVYFSVENNGVGEGIISLYEADEHPPMAAEFISEEGINKRGMTTTSKTKLRACINLKEMIERDKLEIRSNILLAELKTYARKRGSYAALTGSTDDCISAALIVTRLVEEIASYEESAYKTLYTTDFKEWSEDDIGDIEDEEGLPMLF